MSLSQSHFLSVLDKNRAYTLIHAFMYSYTYTSFNIAGDWRYAVNQML